MVNMTLNKSSDRNDFEVDGVRIEITRPHPLLYPMSVYPIPQKNSRVNAFIKLGVRIINDTPIPFHLNLFQSFIPELVTSDGQIIQGYLVTKEVITNTKLNKLLESSQKQKIGWQQIRPESSFGFRLNAMLSWQNSSLQLKIPSPANYVLSSNNLHYFWCFDGLQTHTYQFRFILNTEYQPIYALESNLRQKTTISENRSKILATPWVNLRLVYPLSTDNSAIEVNNIIFQVEMPESVLNIPTRQTVTRTDVKLRVHITNNQSTALYFYQVDSFELTLIGDKDKEISFGSDPTKQVREVEKIPNYHLIQPQKSAVFDLDGIFFWDCGQLKFAISNKSHHYFTGADAFDYFLDLEPGVSYQIQVVYHVIEQKRKQLEERLLEKVWTGWVAMPFVEFCLVES
jgi:hypothetical protein